MKKLTLSFVNNNSPIPIVCFPLSDGKSIYAIIDTGSDSTVYDKNAKGNKMVSTSAYNRSNFIENGME